MYIDNYEADYNLTQCQLERGTERHTAWIPSKFAVVGKHLKIRDEDGWKVTAVYGTSSAREVRDTERESEGAVRRAMEGKPFADYEYWPMCLVD